MGGNAKAKTQKNLDLILYIFCIVIYKCTILIKESFRSNRAFVNKKQSGNKNIININIFGCLLQNVISTGVAWYAQIWLLLLVKELLIKKIVYLNYQVFGQKEEFSTWWRKLYQTKISWKHPPVARFVLKKSANSINMIFSPCS